MKFSPKYLRQLGVGEVGFNVFRNEESVLVLSWETSAEGIKLFNVMAGTADERVTKDRAARHVLWQIHNNILIGDFKHLLRLKRLLKNAVNDLKHSPTTFTFSVTLFGSDSRRHCAYRRLLSQGWVKTDYGEYALQDMSKFLQ